MQERKTIYTPSFIVYTAELAELVREGWEVDLETDAPVAGLQYYASLFREFDENAVDQPPKMHFTEVRANNAAKAREAKAAKKAAQQETNNNE